MSDWQPIETAPRGMDNAFLGWDGHNVERTWEGWTEGDLPVYVYGDWLSWNPTHWMPLPDGPTP